MDSSSTGDQSGQSHHSQAMESVGAVSGAS